MPINLRYYQEDAIRHTWDYINKGGRAGIAAMPTGSGKAFTICEMIRRALFKNSTVRVMMLTHVKELIEQGYKSMKTLWPTAPIGIYSAGVGKRQHQMPITYAGIQSVYTKANIFGRVDILIIDECHLIGDEAESMYMRFIADLKKVNPNLIIIGFTATPFRLKMGYLTEGPIFDEIFYDICTMEAFVKLIDEGYLSELIPQNTDYTIDVSKVKKIAGDFQKKSLDEHTDRDEVTKAIVLETVAKTQDRKKGLAFCVSKSHAENMAQRFNEAGYPAAFIHSDLIKEEREKVLADFKAGKYKVLTNVGVLTTGFDDPEIDFLVMARATESPGLHIQMLGRGMRICDGKENCLVLDFAGNCIRLGPINDPVIPQKKGEGKGEAPIKICPECSTINHASVNFCKYCGFEFPKPEVKLEETSGTGTIIRRDDKPDIRWVKVRRCDVKEHTSKAGNEMIKLEFWAEGIPRPLVKYLSFDKKKPALSGPTWTMMKKFRYTAKQPFVKTTKQGFDFLDAHLIQPDEIRVWYNKPNKEKGKKPQMEIMDFKYED